MLNQHNEKLLSHLTGNIDEAAKAGRELAGNVPTRDLSMVLTKLDEAKMWLERFVKSTGEATNHM